MRTSDIDAAHEHAVELIEAERDSRATEALVEVRNVRRGYRNRGQGREPETPGPRRTISWLQIATRQAHHAVDAALHEDARAALRPPYWVTHEVREMLEHFSTASKPSRAVDRGP